MNENPTDSIDLTELRRKAQEIAQQQPEFLADLPVEDIQELVHELQVHQIELELQNEELRRTQQKLAESHQKYVDLYDFAPVGYFTLSDQLLILEANQTAADMLKVQKHALLKAPFARFVDREDQDQFYVDSRQMLKSRTLHTCQLKMVTQESATFDARLECAATEHNDHALRLRIGVVDISAQVQAARALKESNLRLEQTLAELKDTQQQIVQQERLAAVGQLAAGIAHDFNNILTSVIGFSTLLRSSPEMPPKFQTELALIFDAGQRAARLVQQILDFSRKTIRQPETFDLVNFTGEAVKFLQYTLPETIQILQVVNSDRCLIHADRNQLHQLLTNLAINARDAMPTGGTLKIALSCTTLQPGSVAACPELPAGKWAILSVEDTGTGIPPGILSSIYEPFFTTKPAGQGAGLGLSQVYGIVKQYGGCIDVSSKLGRGTTFTVYLPLQPGQEPPPEPLTSAEYPLGAGENILLVEDDAGVRDACRAMLKQLNYQVFTAANGRDAVTVFLKHRAEISLILTDIVMPIMDGPALLKELKILAPEVNVVMMTGYPLAEKTSKFLEEGVFDWLHKPISFGQLARVIHRACNP